MRSISYTALIIAIVLGSIYGVWLSFEQWNWYCGWPIGPWVQGLVQFGWPTTHLIRVSSLGSPEVDWKWSTRNLCINSGLALVLTLAVSAGAHRIACVIRTNGYISFSLGTLFTFTTAVALVFPLWHVIPWVSIAGQQFWSAPVSDFEISRTMHAVVDVGLFFFAWFVISLAVGATKTYVSLAHRKAVVVPGATLVTTKLTAG